MAVCLKMLCFHPKTRRLYLAIFLLLTNAQIAMAVDVFVDDRCIGSITGPHSLITTAACKPDDELGEFVFNKKTYTLRCYKTPEFNPQTLEHNVAVCIYTPTDETIPVINFTTTDQVVLKYLADFAKTNNIKICGISEKCNNAEPTEPACTNEKKTVRFLTGELETANRLLLECQANP